jgi:DNA-binding response OmpR family regulator
MYSVLTALQEGEKPLCIVSSHGSPEACRCVLVVDDEAAIRGLLTTWLEQHAFVVRTAPDGVSALALLQAEHVDVMLVDWQMPGISGLEMAVEVHRTHPQIPIALMTGAPMTIPPVTLRQTGINRIFAKPFDLEELLGWLSAAPPL